MFSRREEHCAYMGNNRARAAFCVVNDLANRNAAEKKLNFANAVGLGVFEPEHHKFFEDCVNADVSAKFNAKAFKEAKKLLKLK